MLADALLDEFAAEILLSTSALRFSSGVDFCIKVPKP